MNGFAAGWDGGGTKTAVCLTDREGVEIGRETFGALNVNGAPRERVAATIGEIMAWIAQREAAWGPCEAIVVGTAGASNPTAVELIEGCILAAGFGGALSITGDQAIALRGAVGTVGAVLIAGTGTVCCGRNAQGQTHRSGGFGYLIDDEGSGYSIGRDILTAVVRAHDGRGERTVLTELVFAQMGIASIPELIRETYQNALEKRHMAALAPLLQKGLAAGDEASRAIVRASAQELTLLLCTVLGALGLDEGPFAFVGGILAHYPAIAQQVLEQVRARYPKARQIAPIGDAALGAALLACDLL